MKKVLITGGMGFVGSNLTKILVKDKNIKKIILVDNFSNYLNPTNDNFKDFRKIRLVKSSKIHLVRTNVKDWPTVYQVIKKHKPNYIFHTASIPLANMRDSNSIEYKENSVDSTINLIECLNSVRVKNFKRFVYFSSSMVYGDFKKHIVSEDAPKNPKNIYGIMKLSGEVVTKGLCEHYNIPYTIVRPSAVYGPTDMNNRVSQIFLYNASKNSNLIVKGKNEKLDFTYVEDLAKGVLLAAFKNQGIDQIFNITFGKSRKLLDYANLIKKNFKKIKIEVTGRDKKIPVRGTLSIKKAKKLLGYQPKFDLEKGISEYINFYKKLNNLNEH